MTVVIVIAFCFDRRRKPSPTPRPHTLEAPGLLVVVSDVSLREKSNIESNMSREYILLSTNIRVLSNKNAESNNCAKRANAFICVFSLMANDSE